MSPCPAAHPAERAHAQRVLARLGRAPELHALPAHSLAAVRVGRAVLRATDPTNDDWHGR